MAWTPSQLTGSAATSGGKDVLSVSQAVGCAKKQVATLPMLSVVGEVSSFRGPNYRSGHCYFQLKDSSAAVDATVWKQIYESCGFELRDGLQVRIDGKFDIYALTGRMSFVAKHISLAGEGLLRQQVHELAVRLKAEGLTDDSRKLPIPRFCTRVAVVTSLSGSVIDDVKRTLRRRNPVVELLCVDAQVQGPTAPVSLMRGIDVAAAAKPDCILLVRGGGSYEDLMTFNDEALARHVAACEVPIVCGIGHEPDTTICDFVCSRRCSTPTAAAESVAPALDEMLAWLSARQDRMANAVCPQLQRLSMTLDAASDRSYRAIASSLSAHRTRVESLGSHHCLSDPTAMLDDRICELNITADRMRDALPTTLDRATLATDTHARRLNDAAKRLLLMPQATVGRLSATLDALSPLKVLGRGYSIVSTEAGRVVLDASQVSPGDTLNVSLGHGSLTTTVESTSPDASIPVR